MGFNEKIKYLPLLPVIALTAIAGFNLPFHLYDKMRIWFHEIGYLTVFIIGVIFVFYYLKVKKLDIPMRILITATICFTAMVQYEIFWNLMWASHRSIVFLDVLGFIVCEVMLLLTLPMMAKRFKLELPQIVPVRWMIVAGVMFMATLWLNTTGFYQGWSAHYFEGLDVNPHNFEWALGKSISLLSWMGVVDCRRC